MNLPQLTLQLLAKPTPASGRPDAAPLVLGERDLPGQGAPVFLKAQPGVVYNLVDKQTGRVVAAQTTRRKDKHLEVEFEGRPVLVVQDFYETNAWLGPESLHLAAQADDTLNLADLSAYGEQWANWDRIFGGDDVLTADLSSPAAGTAVGSGPTVAPATSVSTPAGSATSSAVGSAVSAVPAVATTVVTGTAVAPATGVASSVGSASGLGGLFAGAAVLAGGAAARGRDTTPPNAPTLMSVTDNHGLTRGTLNAGDSTDDNTPTLRYSLVGSQAVAGDRIQLYNGVTALGSAQVLTQTDIGNGYVDVTPSALYAGQYSFNAKLIDAAGNESTASSSRSQTLLITADQPLQSRPGLPDGNWNTPQDRPALDMARLSDGGYVIAWAGFDEYTNANAEAIYVQRYNAQNQTVGDAPLVLNGVPASSSDVLPQVAALSNGRYVVTWTDWTNVYSQVFSQSNQAVGALQTLQGATVLDSDMPQVLSLTNGGYVLAWQGFDNDMDLFVQAYGADGNALGVQHCLSAAAGFSDGIPALAALPGGGYLVSWSAERQVQGTVLSQETFVQRYDNQSQASGTRVQLSGVGATFNENPSVAVLADGGYVITWEGSTNDAGRDVFAQRFSANNTPVGHLKRMQVQAGVRNADDPKVAALSDGGYVLVWREQTSNVHQDYDIFIQRFDANNAAVGSGHRVAHAAAVNDFEPNVVALPNGGYVIAWTGGSNASSQDVFVQQYGANDQPISTPQRLQSTEGAYEDKGMPALLEMADGGYVVSWQGHISVWDYDIFAQRFDAMGLPVL